MNLPHPLENNIERVLISSDALQKRIAELGEQISADYKDEKPVIIGVLKGATPFMADLVRKITCTVCLDYVAVSSYGGTTKSSGVVRFQKDIEEDIRDRHVIVVEDIVDTGLTLHYLLASLRLRNPKTLKICCLVDKPARRKTDITPDYCGFTIDNLFILGYGMDYKESYRNVNYIGVIKKEAIED